MDSPNLALEKVPGVTVHFIPSIVGLESEWNNALSTDNLFLQADYLLTLEKAPPEAAQLGYLFFEKNGEKIGGAIIQVQYFKANKNIQYEAQPNVGIIERVGKYFRNLVASRVEFYTIICGSMLLTGEHGFSFQEGTLTEKEQLQALDEGLSFAQKRYKLDGTSINGYLIKDFFPSNHDYSRKLKDIGYLEIQVEPNMKLPNVNRWEKFEDYLSDVTSKYRVRYRRARKKASHLKRIELDETAIIEHQDTMHRLYKEIAESSGFNLVNLNKNYMVELKRHLGDRFRMFGYFDGEQLCGFNTTIANGTELEAHFLGFERKVNRSSQLYLNMLYDILQEAIDGNFEEIVYARTALEIKSSLGAEGHDMNCYLKHQNHFANKFVLPTVFSVVKPTKDWVPRNPFKAKNSDT